MFGKKGKNFMNFFGICLISFFLLSPFLSSISIGYDKTKKSYVTSLENNSIGSGLDEEFIYNLTLTLSQIIFTEYNHENEIPKGRFFGSKGELKAADILVENMTKIGLNVTKQRIQPRSDIIGYSLTRLLEVIDYNIRVKGKSIECYVAPSWIHPKTTEQELTREIDQSGLKIKKLPQHPLIYNPEYARESEEFVFITQDQWNDPNASLPRINWLKPFMHPLKFYMLFHLTSLYKIRDETKFFVNNYPNCKGYVLYDFNEECYDMIYFDEPYKNYLPTIFINGSLGKKIWNQPDNYTLDIYLKQSYNDSVESYNIIGEIKGKDPSKTIIISSLYDCWWNQGTADSAIGTSIVLAIAKYYKEYNLKPNYTMKFICFSGEECDIRGAKYYEAEQKEENIICIIDLNQVGFSQNYPPLTFDIVANNIPFLNDIFTIAQDTNYCSRSDGNTELSKILMTNIPSNPLPFSSNRKDCKCVSFFKDGGWILHHRNGQNYREGDVFKYYDTSEVNLTGELILNITKSVTLDNTFFDKYDECRSNHFLDIFGYLTSLINIGPKKAR